MQAEQGSSTPQGQCRQHFKQSSCGLACRGVTTSFRKTMPTQTTMAPLIVLATCRQDVSRCWPAEMSLHTH